MPLMKLRPQPVRLAGRADVGQRGEQLAEHHRDLPAGQVGAQAEVRAGRRRSRRAGWGRGATSKRYGSSNTASSRLAEP